MRYAPLASLALLSCIATRVEAPPFDTADQGAHEHDDAPAPDLPDDDPRNANFRTRAGDYALDYLRSDTYQRIVVEVDYIQGRRPKASAVRAIRETLEALCNKPGGVEVLIDDAIPESTGGPAWTIAEGQDVEIAWRSRYHDPDSGTAAIYFLYLSGQSARSANILGYAYRGSSLVMFPDRISNLEPPLLGAFVTDPEDVVAGHELGHILGLVNNGIPMVEPHQDQDNGAHDSNDRCIMHWTIEGPQLREVLVSRRPVFDRQCLDDVEAAGGRRRQDANRDQPSQGSVLDALPTP